MNRGKIFFISGPSGVGKGSLIDELKRKYKGKILFPPSCTTRAPRPGEVDGETYFFISKEAFQQKIEAGEFLEWACVHGENFYGTLKGPLVEPAQAGQIVIREFDVQGFEAAREALPRDLYTSIFLMPAEDIEDLVDRIRKRAPISDEEVEKRVESMKKELAKSDIYDHKVLSRRGHIAGLVADAEAIILAD